MSALYPEIRMRLRLAVMMLLTGLGYLAYVVGRYATGDNDARNRRIRRLVLKVWGRSVCWLMGMRLHVEGKPPKPPFYLVSNHVSYVDILVMSNLVGPVFVAKGDMETWPLWGKMMSSAHQIFIWREDLREIIRVNKLIDAVLEQRHDGICVFPEATTTKGDHVLPFKPALIQPAVRHGVPITYASIWYAERPRARGPVSEVVAWWRDDDPFLRHICELLRNPGFDCYVRFGRYPIVGTDRKVVARMLYDAVNEQFVPMA